MPRYGHAVSMLGNSLVVLSSADGTRKMYLANLFDLSAADLRTFISHLHRN